MVNDSFQKEWQIKRIRVKKKKKTENKEKGFQLLCFMTKLNRKSFGLCRSYNTNFHGVWWLFWHGVEEDKDGAKWWGKKVDEEAGVGIRKRSCFIATESVSARSTVSPFALFKYHLPVFVIQYRPLMQIQMSMPKHLWANSISKKKK